MLTNILNIKTLRRDKDRLQTLLDVMPFPYAADIGNAENSFITSNNLAALLGCEDTLIQGFADILNALSPADAAALDGAWTNLKQNGDPFTLAVKTASSQPKTLQINGRKQSEDNQDSECSALFFVDITDNAATIADKTQTIEALSGDNTRFQIALDAIPDPLWMTGEQSRIIWCNKAYADSLDATQASIIADQKILPLKPLKNKDDERQIFALIKPDGKRHVLSVSKCSAPLLNATLHLAGDITREQDVLAARKRYNAAYQELLEQLETAVVIFNVDQRLEFYNSSFAQLWHVEDSYLNRSPKLGDLMEKMREMRRLPEQADFRSFKQGWLNMFTNMINAHEDMLYLPDGAALRMLVVPHPMGGLMMTFEDVSSRLELESSYNTLIAVQQETLDNLTEGVAAFGGDGRLKLYNPAFGNLWKLNPEDLNAQPHINRLVEKMKPRIAFADWEDTRETLIKQCLTREKREGRLEFNDLTLVEYTTVPLPDGGVLVSHVDITDTARVEQALRDKNAALETAEKLKADFLANVSYQLRTPLNAIMGFAEILHNEYFGDLNDKQKEYSNDIQDAGNRLMRLINDILDLSTIEAGYLELNYEDTPLSEILGTICDLAKDWAQKDQVTFTANLPDDDIIVHVDQLRMKQIMMNLISNAINFTPEGGKITLSAKVTKTKFMMSVKDTGSGIAVEDQERIFTPFERSADESLHQKRDGVGLGLSLVKNIVELHGGHITLESTEGVGTTVMITCPIGDVQAK